MQPLTPEQLQQLILWHTVQHSISSFNKLIAFFGDATTALLPSALEGWQQLKIHANHLTRFKQLNQPQGQSDWHRRWTSIQQYCPHIIFQTDEHYPELLRQLDDAPPLLCVVGDVALLSQPQIAMVGSRQMSAHGKQIAFDFANYFAQADVVVTSGLALGVDAACHRGALQHGKTIAVIGTGLDLCYPAEHQQLWQQIIAGGGAIVSEFLPHTPPMQQNFPRRNRLISGLSLGTVVVEAGLKSGSLITAKIAAHQGRQVFAIPGHIYSSHHQGCHQLIREGATLVDNPQQVIEDLSAFRPLPRIHPPVQQAVSAARGVTQQTPMATPVQPTISVPPHLQAVYDAIDWIGVSVDDLALRLALSISELNIALVELELLELCKQHGGRYIRCGHG